jgi:hypothetical protein
MVGLAVIHGDGTTTAAKKGGDNLGFSDHKKVKGCQSALNSFQVTASKSFHVVKLLLVVSAAA